MPINNLADRYLGHWLREQFVGIAFSVLTVAVVTVLISFAEKKYTILNCFPASAVLTGRDGHCYV